ncbi:unnamed protein product [Closterium sp. NIES-53]
MVFPLQSKADVSGVLIRWIRAVSLQLRARFQQDLPVLRLHSDRGGVFCSHLLEDFYGAEGIVQSYTLPASPQQNGIAERRIGLVMEVARTSMIHAATPHFLLPFAVRYAAEQLNLWPRVSHPETSPTLWWTGEVGDASAFRFYHPGSRRVLSSCDVTFDESVCFYRLHPHRSSPAPLPPLSLVDDPPPVAPLPPRSHAPSGVSQVDPPPLVEPLEVSSDTSGPAEGGDLTPAATVTPRRSARLAVPPGFQPRPSSPPLKPVTVDFGAAVGGTTGGAGSGDAGSRGAECPLGTGGTGGTGAGGPATRRQETLSPERLCELAVQWCCPGGGASRAARGAGGAGSRGASPGGAGAGVPGTGGTGAAGGAGGSRGASLGGASAGVPGTGGSGAAGGATGGAGTAGGARGATGGTTGGTGVSAGGTGSGGVVATRAGGSGRATTQPQPSALSRLLSLPPAATEFPVLGTTPPLLFPPLLPGSPLPAPAPHTEVTASLTAHREPETRGSTPEHREPKTRASVPARVRCPRAPAVPGTHDMTLRPSSIPRRVVLPSPPASSLLHVPDPESDLVSAASPNVTRLLATVVTGPSFESAATFSFVAELVDFAALCRLDYATSLVFYSSCPPSTGGELALGCDVLEDRQFDLECLVAAAPHLASTLLCPEGDPDALDIPTPRTYAEAITGPYSSHWQIAMDVRSLVRSF